MQADGSGPVRNLDLDLGRSEINAIALFVALLVATPLPAASRLVIVHRPRPCAADLLLLGILSFYIWREIGGSVLLVTLSPSLESAHVGPSGRQFAPSKSQTVALPGNNLDFLAVCCRPEDFRRWGPRNFKLRFETTESDSSSGLGTSQQSDFSKFSARHGSKATVASRTSVRGSARTPLLGDVLDKSAPWLLASAHLQTVPGLPLTGRTGAASTTTLSKATFSTTSPSTVFRWTRTMAQHFAVPNWTP